VYSPQGGGERRYLLHLPGGFSTKNDRPAPVVVALHAFGQTTASMEDMTGFSDDGVNEGHVAVYPEGVNVGLIFFRTFFLLD
jgi:poly(3-hydroxybutyrate) depolymerase